MSLPSGPDWRYNVPMRRLILAASVAFSLAATCKLPPVPGPPSGVGGSGTGGASGTGGSGGAGIGGCAAAEQNLAKMRCVGVEDFLEACEYAWSDRRYWPWQCIATSATCEEADRCR
jgi:hypothetical protein